MRFQSTCAVGLSIAVVSQRRVRVFWEVRVQSADPMTRPLASPVPSIRCVVARASDGKYSEEWGRWQPGLWNGCSSLLDEVHQSERSSTRLA